MVPRTFRRNFACGDFFQSLTLGPAQNLQIHWEMISVCEKCYSVIPYYRKLTLNEIKVLEINANLMENDFRIKKINAKEEVEFHNKGN